MVTTATSNDPDTRSRLRERPARRPWIGAALLLFVPLSALFLGPAAIAAHRKVPLQASRDPNYVLALATANRFMYAWQAGELGNGLALLSDGIRQTQNAGEIERFFSPEADRAFEIGKGSGNRGHFSFPVVLVSLKASAALEPAAAPKAVSRRFSSIVLVDSGKNDWVVDKLP
jgi:hypothetical protein